MPDQSPINTSPKSSAWFGWLLIIVAMIATFLLGLLATSIIQRREEARERLPLATIAQWETDNAKWGENYPREYASYKEMYDHSRHTKYVGPFPRDYLAETPANVVLFAGYAFAKEYNQARGHVYTIEDVTKTKRVSDKTVATCWTCKSPDVPRMMAEIGPEKFYSGKFMDLKPQITHSIGCLDCHEPNTMKLRITRPALREALQRQGKDVDQVSHQEMRTLVCAQCHVEYYFKPGTNYLTFPWDKGTTPEQMDEYYAGIDFSDWTHAISKAKMIKIQHPDYEVFRTGVHAYRNIACADCHMPYRSEGGAKFTDHHIQSPMLNISNSCVVCHRWSEDEIKSRVEAIQDKVHQGRVMAESMISKAHLDIAAAEQAGAKDEELAEVRKLVRSAQLRWDYVAANNGMGFHSPQECMRILANAIDLAGQCRIDCAHILAKHGVTDPVKYPDTDTKEKAQSVIKQFIDGTPPKLL